jgi:hypothetical protein
MNSGLNLDLNWPLIWQVCLLVSLALFACMAIVTTIGGAGDVRKLLRSLAESENEDDTEK